MKFRTLVFYFLFIFAESLTQQTSTSNGPVKGIAKTTNSGKTYHAYYSIPYAKPPTGTRRFLASELPDPWTDVYDATQEKPNICYQLYADFAAETEDCLYLNVFTPQDPSKSSKNLPVMINIHGGAFVSGSGLESTASIGGFSPKYLLENDVIFVSFNYRLGIFGFLSTGDTIIPGNAGLKDQVLALKWIHQNIAAFGGDPNKITIFGQSAGASSVGYHIISPASKGLFSSAILESGTPLCSFGYQRNAKDISFKTGALIDKRFETSKNSGELLQVLQNISSTDLDQAALNFANWDSGQPGAAGRGQLQQGFYFSPVIEVANGNTSFLTDYQYELLEKGNINKVPILMGVCAEEGLLNLDQWINYTLQGYDSDFSYMAPHNLHIKEASASQEIGRLIKQRYSPDNTFLNNPAGAIKYFTDHNFVKPSTKHAELQSKYTDVFYYEFSYSGKMGGNTNQKLPGTLNVTHTEEFGYIFNGGPLEWFPESDRLVHNRIMRIWTNFAIYHNPTPTPEELLQNITWPKVQPGNFTFVNIGNLGNTDLNIVEGKPKADGMAFWENIYTKYGSRPFDTY